jgi:O-antigen ligase
MSTQFISGACALVVSVLVAVALVANPTVGVGMTLAVVGLALVARELRTPASRVVVMSALYMSATVDFIGRIQLGSTSAYAWVTVGIVVASVSLVLALPIASVPKSSRRMFLVMSLFPIWAVAMAVLTTPSQAGAQNILVYVCLVSVAALTASALSSGVITLDKLDKALFTTFTLGSTLFVISMLLEAVGKSPIVSPRSYGLFAAVGVAWAASKARYGARAELRLAFVMSILILASLSRTAAGVAILIFALTFIKLRTPRDVARTIAVVSAVAVFVGIALTQTDDPFSRRFTHGDVVGLPLGVELNVMGREALWATTWGLGWQSPVFGSGAGAASAAVQEKGFSAHPHNDYLRIFADFGLVGVLAFAALLLAPTVRAIGQLRSRSQEVSAMSVHVGALMAILALALEMVTDNAVVYLFIVVPTAVIIGASAGQQTAGSGESR